VADGRLTLVYDAECEFCTRLARWVERQDRRGRVSVRANQQAGLIESLGLTREEVGRAAWAVEESGRKFEGAAAINRVLRELGGGWTVLGRLYAVPPIGWLENQYYKRVARKRSWL
jgi:predicted DCC family thiol-disulfide oxidoreductase YuxK